MGNECEKSLHFTQLGELVQEPRVTEGAQRQLIIVQGKRSEGSLDCSSAIIMIRSVRALYEREGKEDREPNALWILVESLLGAFKGMASRA